MSLILGSQNRSLALARVLATESILKMWRTMTWIKWWRSDVAPPFISGLKNPSWCSLWQEIYAASLLCILGQLFSKLSMVVFIRRLTPSFENKRVGKAVEALIYVWATITFFGSAFSCVAPRTFDFWQGHCVDLVWHLLVKQISYILELANTILRKNS